MTEHTFCWLCPIVSFFLVLFTLYVQKHHVFFSFLKNKNKQTDQGFFFKPSVNTHRTSMSDLCDTLPSPLYLPVRIIHVCPYHLHGPLPYPTGTDVSPQPQIQNQAQRARQGAGKHHANLGQPGQTRRQLEAVT